MKLKRYIKPITETIHVHSERLLAVPSDQLKKGTNEVRNSESQASTSDINTGKDTEGVEGGFNGAKGNAWSLWDD